MKSLTEKYLTKRNPREENFTPLKIAKSYVYFYYANIRLSFAIFFYFYNIESRLFFAGYVHENLRHRERSVRDSP